MTLPSHGSLKVRLPPWASRQSGLHRLHRPHRLYLWEPPLTTPLLGHAEQWAPVSTKKEKRPASVSTPHALPASSGTASPANGGYNSTGPAVRGRRRALRFPLSRPRTPSANRRRNCPCRGNRRRVPRAPIGWRSGLASDDRRPDARAGLALSDCLLDWPCFPPCGSGNNDDFRHRSRC